MSFSALKNKRPPPLLPTATGGGGGTKGETSSSAHSKARTKSATAKLRRLQKQVATTTFTVQGRRQNAQLFHENKQRKERLLPLGEQEIAARLHLYRDVTKNVLDEGCTEKRRWGRAVVLERAATGKRKLTTEDRLQLKARLKEMDAYEKEQKHAFALPTTHFSAPSMWSSKGGLGGTGDRLVGGGGGGRNAAEFLYGLSYPRAGVGAASPLDGHPLLLAASSPTAALSSSTLGKSGGERLDSGTRPTLKAHGYPSSMPMREAEKDRHRWGGTRPLGQAVGKPQEGGGGGTAALPAFPRPPPPCPLTPLTETTDGGGKERRWSGERGAELSEKSSIGSSLPSLEKMHSKWDLQRPKESEAYQEWVDHGCPTTRWDYLVEESVYVPERVEQVFYKAKYSPEGMYTIEELQAMAGRRKKHRRGEYRKRGNYGGSSSSNSSSNTSATTSAGNSPKLEDGMELLHDSENEEIGSGEMHSALGRFAESTMRPAEVKGKK